MPKGLSICALLWQKRGREVELNERFRNVVHPGVPIPFFGEVGRIVTRFPLTPERQIVIHMPHDPHVQ